MQRTLIPHFGRPFPLFLTLAWLAGCDTVVPESESEAPLSADEVSPADAEVESDAGHAGDWIGPPEFNDADSALDLGGEAGSNDVAELTENPSKQGGAVTVHGERQTYEMPDSPFAGSTHVPAADSVWFSIWRASADGDYRYGVSGTIQFDADGTVRACDQLAYPSQLQWSAEVGSDANSYSVDSWCQISVSVRPVCPGDWIVGTFSGQLIDSKSGEVVELVDGEFANRVNFMLHGAPPAPGCPD